MLSHGQMCKRAFIHVFVTWQTCHQVLEKEPSGNVMAVNNDYIYLHKTNMTLDGVTGWAEAGQNVLQDPAKAVSHQSI